MTVASISHPIETPLSAGAIAEDFTRAELRILVYRDDAVIAEQAVAGESQVFRQIVCQLSEPGRWRVAYCIARGRYQHDLMARRVFTDLLELGLFVGGCLSTPISPAEVAALQSGLRLL